tara:strand:+ start:282 stop:452 length:171 start_codon:yes stop_codon:yes gene_type:complete
MSWKYTPKTFDECYEELSKFLSERGIGSDKVEGDPVYALAKDYCQHEQRTYLESIS